MDITESLKCEKEKDTVAYNALIEINANAIKSKVTADEVTSQIEQSAEAIRCQAKKISWKSDDSEMTETGKKIEPPTEATAGGNEITE